MCSAPLVLWGVCGVCCFVVFVGGFSGGVTPGPFPNPEAKPACADGTAPGRVWESRSLPASFFVVEGVWVRGLVDCPVWMVGRFLCLCTLCFFCAWCSPTIHPTEVVHGSPPGTGDIADQPGIRSPVAPVFLLRHRSEGDRAPGTGGFLHFGTVV